MHGYMSGIGSGHIILIYGQSGSITMEGRSLAANYVTKPHLPGGGLRLSGKEVSAMASREASPWKGAHWQPTTSPSYISRGGDYA
jgi:hypothetical protein